MVHDPQRILAIVSAKNDSIRIKGDEAVKPRRQHEAGPDELVSEDVTVELQSTLEKT